MAETPKMELSAEEHARAKFLDDTRELLRQPEFRRWLWHLIEDPGWCAIHRHDDDLAGDSLQRALGKRQLGLLLNQTAMAVADESYRKMLLEAMNLKVQRELIAEGRPTKARE